MTDSGLKIYSFLSWAKYESDSLSELVYLLKTKTSRPAWSWFVQYFESEICQIVDQKYKSIIVPIPGSRNSYHTENFALEIQNLTGCKAVSLLRNSGLKSMQKTKSRTERNRIQFEVCEEFTNELTVELSGISKIYLIDDIVTTGSTLRAASKALKSYLSAIGNPNSEISAVVLLQRTKR